MTFRFRLFLGVITLFALSSSCKYNAHQGEVYCEVKPLQTASGWGYEIYIDKKLYIKQDFIPVIYGKHAFKSEEDAMKTGKLVLNKITHGKLPALTLEDLKNLNVVQ